MLESLGILYIAACAILLGVRHRRDKGEWWLRFTLAAALPVVGLLLPVFWPKSWHRRNEDRRMKKGTDIFKDIEFLDQSGDGIYSRMETEKEMNVVPLEEALLVNDLPTRRRVMIDLLKKDSMEYLEVLQMAVGNEDTETSHYAVSAIMEVKRKLTLTLQDLGVKFEENRDDPHLLRSYADVLKGYMRSGFLDERSLNKHKYTYVTVLERYLELVPDESSAYGEKTEAELELGEYAAAERTAKLYLERFPRSEDAYLNLLRIYYSIRSYSRLQETLAQLKQSPVRLSNRGLTVVRFWSEGARRSEFED